MALTKFPGLIDVHVHLRDPGSTQKEDFYTGSRAAIKGGITFMVDMPNNPGSPTISAERLEEKIRLSHEKSICDIGFHYGTDGKNMDSFSAAYGNAQVFGLKIYAGHTTGELLVQDEKTIEEIIRAWNSQKPILLHAEGARLELALSIASHLNRRMHVCHLAEQSDIALVRKVKAQHQAVTAGVTPHHLFLTDNDVKKLGNFGLVKPFISDQTSQDALWEALEEGIIDLVESDHAPHTKEEKQSGTPTYGVPGLETTLGLLCKAVKENRLSHEQIIALMHDNPKKIFSIPDQTDTYIELDPDKPYIVGADGYETKCGWSPFDGWELYGKVETVVLRGKTLVEMGTIV